MPYKITHKYKGIIKREIDNMMKEGIIYPVDQSKWTSPMVVQPRKYDPKKLRGYANFIWINRVTLIGPFPTPFIDKIINEVVGH